MEKETEAAMIAAGTAAQMTSALAVMLARTLDRPDIVRDFTALLRELDQRPGVHPAQSVVYRQCADALQNF